MEPSAQFLCRSGVRSDTSALAPVEPYIVEVDLFNNNKADSGHEQDGDLENKMDNGTATEETHNNASGSRTDVKTKGSGVYIPPPTVAEAQSALNDLKAFLAPQ